jgi:hypothetical protein
MNVMFLWRCQECVHNKTPFPASDIIWVLSVVSLGCMSRFISSASSTDLMEGISYCSTRAVEQLARGS